MNGARFDKTYGWQTSAREGGRTLRALERRGFAVVRHDNEWRKWLWNLTTSGELERARRDIRSDIMDAT